MKVAPDAELRYLDFIGPESFARPADRVVFGVVEIVDVVDVSPDSGVKNFVSIGDSFVRALPLSHVKSAKAKGSVAGAFATPDLPFSVACGPTAARKRSPETDTEFPEVVPGKILGAGAVTGDAAGLGELSSAVGDPGTGAVVELSLDSTSAKRFSSCSTRSSSHRSRSVNGAGASIFVAVAGLAEGSPLSSSLANATTGTALPQDTATNMSGTSLFNLKMCILLPYL